MISHRYLGHRRHWAASVAAIVVAAACSGGPAGTAGSLPTSSSATATPLPPTAMPTATPGASVTPATLVSIPVGQGPISLAASEDAIWVENHRDNDLSRIDPATNEVVAHLDDVRVHCTLTYADGSVWTAEFSAGVVTRVDAETNLVLDTIEVPDACGVTVDGDDLWITSPRQGVFRYSVESGEQVDHFELSGMFGVSPGFDSLWAMTEIGGGAVRRIDPDTGDIEAEIRIPGADGQLVAFDAVWASSRNGRSVYRIDPESNLIADQVDVGGPVGGFGAGADAIFATTLGGDLVEIDPVTVDIVHRAALGFTHLGPPVEAFGSIWTASLDDNVVLRVDPLGSD